MTTQKEEPVRTIAVLTSGGDAQGMNAAVRAVVRTALERGARVFAIREGYEGMVDGGERIQAADWDSVGGILHQGGTVIGSARSQRFRTHEGRLQAAENLVRAGIDSLVVIGGDGSLTGADMLRREWTSLVEELVGSGRLEEGEADRRPLSLVGLVGSIDNDMFGTDMTIGTDTALHRITEAVDAISSTAASHQRTFVVEVMGRHCGYLALMGAISTGASWVLIPENPPDVDDWEATMCARLKAGREAGRRDSIVIVAEGARDRHGQPITAGHVRDVLHERLGEDVRITILGHVQRGGAPSAFDRYMSTMLGYAAVEELLSSPPGGEAQLIGMKDNRVTRQPLMQCVEQTHKVAERVNAGDFAGARKLRGTRFESNLRTLRTIVRALPHPPTPGQTRLNIALIHSGGPAPGMNTAVRASLRLALDQGHRVLAIRNGFRGFVEGDFREMEWMSVNGWASRGGAELGTNRKVPADRELYTIARHIEAQKIDAILMIGGWSGYRAIHKLRSERERFPAFDIPMICMPTSINNNLAGSEISIGSDTALNNIVGAVDKIKQSAVASKRCFVVEVMGRKCGFLALLGGLATGAERVYIHEEGVTLADLQRDLTAMIEGFRQGKRLGLVVRAAEANPLYTTPFMYALFEEEGGDLFDVRQAILGHIQQGGDPSPYDRILATRFAAECVGYLIRKAQAATPEAAFIGVQEGRVVITPIDDLPRLMDMENERPRDQWWRALAPIARLLAQPGPKAG
ncbi:MAG: 6-phosphofructokinase [Acidobacteria bacterium]|jgi:6-phosphofructokinase 1|nr:6-phosphofructokinase [Acidobacteriota bacterium]